MIAGRSAPLAIALVAAAVIASRSAVRAGEVTIPLTDLGYRDGVTVAGVAPSVTFDLPRYASLRAARLELELHASPNADPASTVTVGVDGRPVFRRTLRAIGGAPRLAIPLPIPAANARTFAITVGGALRVAGDPCAPGTSRTLFLRVGRDSAIVLDAVPDAAAEAFFRDYRSAVDVRGSLADPLLPAVPYRLDRLEPWHRVDATLVDAAVPGHRTLVLGGSGAAVRRGDVLQIAPAAFAALPVPLGQSPARHAAGIAFRALRQNLGTATGLGDLAFDVPLAASIVGGTPLGLRVHVVVAHSALPPAVTGTLQVLVNGMLIGARALGRPAEVQTLDVAVPASAVGPANDVRVLVATEVPPAACVPGAPGVTATLLDASAFRWSGVSPRAVTIESFLTALHGRVIVLDAPPFARAAFHFMSELGAMNAAIAQLDVARFAGTVPVGYDAAIVFAPPDELDGLGLPIRTAAPVFEVVNPTDAASVLHAGAATAFALLQLGEVRGTPLLALTYHGDPSGIAGIETVRASQLATQVAPVTVIDARGATAYDIGDKLRVSYAGDATLDRLWVWVRIGVALGLIAAILAGAAYSARRLTGKTPR
jgi:hypothetical protein